MVGLLTVWSLTHPGSSVVRLGEHLPLGILCIFSDPCAHGDNFAPRNLWLATSLQPPTRFSDPEPHARPEAQKQTTAINRASNLSQEHRLKPNGRQCAP